MSSFIFRVCAHHGDPVTVGETPTRAGLCHDIPFAADRVVNDPNNDVIKDLVQDANASCTSEYDIGRLLEDFEDEYGCKVGTDETARGETQVFEFDIFEPSWPDDDEAKDAIDDLAERLTDWVEGYPTGR
jgi:hypothetical protein